MVSSVCLIPQGHQTSKRHHAVWAHYHPQPPHPPTAASTTHPNNPQPPITTRSHPNHPAPPQLLPTAPNCQVSRLDTNVSWVRALDGSEYMPGLVGLNNMKSNDYANVVLQVLARVTPIR